MGFAIGFDTFTIEVFICAVMLVCSRRTHIKAGNASLAPLVLNQCLYKLDLRGHTFLPNKDASPSSSKLEMTCVPGIL